MSVVEVVNNNGPVIENITHEDVSERVIRKPVYEQVVHIEHVVEQETLPSAQYGAIYVGEQPDSPIFPYLRFELDNLGKIQTIYFGTE